MCVSPENSSSASSYSTFDSIKHYALNPAILITLIRLFSAVTVFPFLIFYSAGSAFHFLCIASLFVAVAATDFLDGYVARSYQLQTTVGAWLDLVSDKVLVATMLLLLVWLGKLLLSIALLFILRELIVMGCRWRWPSYARQVGVIPVAKYKTALQMTYIAIAVSNHPAYSMRYGFMLTGLEWFMGALAFLITWYTGMLYCVTFFNHMLGNRKI